VPQTPLGDLKALFRSRRFSGGHGLLLRRGKRRKERTRIRGGAQCSGEYATVTGMVVTEIDPYLGWAQASHQLNPALGSQLDRYTHSIQMLCRPTILCHSYM